MIHVSFTKSRYEALNIFANRPIENQIESRVSVHINAKVMHNKGGQTPPPWGSGDCIKSLRFLYCTEAVKSGGKGIFPSPPLQMDLRKVV